MDLDAALSSLDTISRNFSAKNRQLLHLQLLHDDLQRRLVERYLAFQPRNSFQGLPPLKDEVCVNWVEEMIRTGIHLVAICPEAGIVGHTALFPIDRRKCEMLVVVWPEFQNIGIGTELTRECVQMASKLGFEKMWLPVDATNLRARHIYAKCGFEYASSKQARELDMVCNLSRFRENASEAIKAPEEMRIPAPHFDLKPVAMPSSLDNLA